jgi:hypothetical protein
MQKQVSLKTAKRLAEAGILLKTEKEYAFGENKWMLVPSVANEEDFIVIPAPDIPELLAELPPNIKYEKDVYYLTIGMLEVDDFVVEYINADNHIIPRHNKGQELVEALADCLLWVRQRSK